MPIYDNEIVFLHIPKTGGTVIENLLKKQRKETFYGASKSGFSMQHYTMDKLNTYINKNNNLFKNNVFKFTFLRNPFDKILSSYLCWGINNTPDFDKYIDMVKNVVENKLYLTTVAINTNDLSNFIPMTEMIGRNEVHFLGKFEDFDNDINILSIIEPRLKYLNEIVIKKNNVNYRDYYNERNRKIIEELYAEDLKRFNYSF